MSSIIVLDSSDEDEVPTKKANLKPASDAGNYSSNTNASILKTQNSKQRSIPSSITVTPRPLTTGAKTSNNNITMAATLNQAITNIMNHQEQQQRQTLTPPNKGQSGTLMQNQRKRKTPTPPQQQQQTMPRLAAKPFATMTNSSPAKAATTIAPLPPIMPMITGVLSMATAGATPPLQLMATPPHHNMAGFMGLNEQLMINPHLIPTNLPPNTTITAHPNLNPNQNNINNNFKIHLPLKPPTTTPSPAASPASSAPKTPSPQLAASPQPQGGGRMSDKTSRRIKPTTVVRSTDEAWLQQRHKQSSQRPSISLHNDVVVEMLPPSTTESPKSSSSASSSRHHTPMTSPTATPKSQKSPDVIMITSPPQAHNNASNEVGTILDLTHSPQKLNANEIVDLVDSTPNKKQLNGEDLTTPKNNKSSNDTNSSTGKTSDSKAEKPPPKPPLEPEYEELIKVCRAADPTPDMEKLIKSKLLKYYYEVHGDFVKSKSFRKSIRKVVATIKAEPDLVYYNLKTIVEELKVRRKAKIVEIPVVVEVAEEQQVPAPMIQIKKETAEVKENITNTKASSTSIPANESKTITDAAAPAATSSASISATGSTSTGNKKLDEQIKKLNKALYVITKRIEVLDQSDVDLDDDDSSFLQVERFKKRACQIYEKICDLTGESKNASRLVSKPIKFNETRIPQFNKCLQAFINRTKEFPDYYDVLRMLEHCNRTYNLGLVNFEIKNIAEDAFIKVGKRLQSRRKADLYETVTHYGGNAKDPAKTDPVLASKLSDNLKKHKKITDILEKFARKQDMPDEEEEDKAENSQSTESNNTQENTPTDVKTDEENKPTTDNINEIETTKENIKQEKELKKEVESVKKETSPVEIVYEDDDDDDDEEDEDEENLEEHVEILANGDVSDNESDVETTEIINVEKTVTKESIIGKINDKIPNNDDANAMEVDLVEIFDKSINDASMECITDLKDKKIEKRNSVVNSDNNISIEIVDNSQEEFIAINPTPESKKLDTDIIQIDSQTESECLNNNNNNIIIEDEEETTIKTATLTNDINEVKSVSLTPPPNGKLKDTSPNQLNNSLELPSSTSCTATIIATSTTTTKADLKIVHVSSLDHHHHRDNDTPILINANDDSSLCTDLTTNAATTTNKSLEEIIISDEES